jgi:hypothetical protein
MEGEFIVDKGSWVHNEIFSFISWADGVGRAAPVPSAKKGFRQGSINLAFWAGRRGIQVGGRLNYFLAMSPDVSGSVTRTRPECPSFELTISSFP